MVTEERKGVLEVVFYCLAILISAYLVAHSYITGAYMYYGVPFIYVVPNMSSFLSALGVIAVFVFIFSSLFTSFLLLLSKSELVRITFWFAFLWAVATWFLGFNLLITIIIVSLLVYYFVMPLIKYAKLKISIAQKISKMSIENGPKRVKMLEKLPAKYRILAVMIFVICIGAYYSGKVNAANISDYNYVKYGSMEKSVYLVVGKYKGDLVAQRFLIRSKRFDKNGTKVFSYKNLGVGDYKIKTNKSSKKKSGRKKKK